MALANNHLATVLILDDDIDVLAANARYLRLNNINAIVCDKPEFALKKIDESRVDIIITDLRMPEMDGLAFVKELRKTHPLLPVLFFSGYAEIADVVEAMKLGAIDFLEKTISPEDLLSTLKYIISLDGDAMTPRQAFLPDAAIAFKKRVHLYEKHLIETCIAKHNGYIQAVLDELNINRRTLNDKMSKLGISR
jgi:DNA-binding NtrC family response regulator